MSVKVLTAAVDGDPAGWCWCVPGELVVAANLCDLDGDPDHDPEHDCRRSFIGIASGRAATCARVADVDHDPAQLLEVIRDWYTGGDVDEKGEAEVVALLAAAEPYAVGTFLHRRDDKLVPL